MSEDQRLSATQAIAQVIARDMNGDPDWRLSVSARIELVRLLPPETKQSDRGIS